MFRITQWSRNEDGKICVNNIDPITQISNDPSIVSRTTISLGIDFDTVLADRLALERLGCSYTQHQPQQPQLSPSLFCTMDQENGKFWYVYCVYETF